MKKSMVGLLGALALGAGLTAGGGAQAAVVINIVERSDGVFIDISGSLDLTGFTPIAFDAPTFLGILNPTNGTIGVFIDPAVQSFGIARAGAPELVFGPGVGVGRGTTSITGSTFRITQGPMGDIIQVGPDYRSDDPISAFIAFGGLSFADLGILAMFNGTRIFPNGDFVKITTRIEDVSDVPLPGAAALFASAILAGFAKRRRKASAL